MDFKIWFNDLPVPVKIIVFQGVALTATALQTYITTKVVSIDATLLAIIVIPLQILNNIIAWKLAQLTPEQEKIAKAEGKID